MENQPNEQKELGSQTSKLKDILQKLEKFYRAPFFLIGYAVVFLILLYFLFFSAPSGFNSGAITNIEEGASLRSVSLKLKNEHIIRSTIAFEAFVILYGGEKHIIPTDYLFERRLPVFEVARRITKGEHHLAPIKVTIPEGFNNEEIAENFASKLKNFDENKFLQDAEEKQGYLFPDTYFFLTIDDEEDVLRSMSENFDKKILSVRPKISASGKTERDIIIMASIIEREAKGDGDRGFISGILWRRISIGMPLQADAAPETYQAKGLPKVPIGNPGLEAINAAIYPEKSGYLYYLHDKEGNIHYAKTFEEHRANRLKYLN